MLRRIVMLIYSFTGITPDKVITYFIVLGSLVVFELGSLAVRKLVIDRLSGRKSK